MPVIPFFFPGCSCCTTQPDDTVWLGETDETGTPFKLWLQSGEFTSTIKNSINIEGATTDTPQDGVEQDGFDYITGGKATGGTQLPKNFWWSSFTSTIKDSLEFGASQGNAQSASEDGTNSVGSHSSNLVLYKHSGKITSTVKDSQDMSSVDAFNLFNACVDATDTMWSGTAQEAYVTSGQFTTTVKTQLEITAVNRITGHSWDGIDTFFADVNNTKLYRLSGRFTNTVHDSEDVSGVSSGGPRGIGSLDDAGRLT